MIQIKSFIPEGVADTHCNEYEMKENTIMDLKRTFKGFGYRQIQTPTFEYFDLFSGVEGTLDKDEMFKFIDGNGKILVLRPDVTTPIARMVATNYKDCTGYLKFSYVANIFRINDEQNGMKREFTQAGIEYLGNKKPDGDGEVIALAIKSLLNCGLTDFQIDLGQANYFKGFIKALGISKEEQLQVRKLIENRNFAELKFFIENIEVEDSLKKGMTQIPYLYGKPEEVMDEAEKFVCNEEMKNALENLMNVYKILKDYGYEKYISFDLGLINHIDYYTGVVFKGYVNNYGRALLSGGRYDHLTKQYGYDMTATGFGLNVDALLEVLDKYQVNREFTCATDYLVLYEEEDREKGFSLATKLRERDFIVESDLYVGNMEEHIQNGKYRNIKEIILIDGPFIKAYSTQGDEMYSYTIEEFLKEV